MVPELLRDYLSRMTRQDFLRQISLGAAFVLTVPCLHSCDKDDNGDDAPAGEHPGAGDVNFTIDVTDAQYADGLAARGYVVVQRVVVARLAGGGFAAASQVCSHEDTQQVIYDGIDEEWFCLTHGARFERGSGAPKNDITNRALRIYTTSLSGNMLTVS